MTEGLSYSRNPDISILGLTQLDLDLRGIIVAGHSKEELLPPYQDKNHEERAKAILKYSDQWTKTMRLSSAGDSFDIPVRQKFPDTKVIEVVGGYVDFCVFFVIASITESGLIALVKSKMMLSSRPKNSDYTLGRIILRNQKDMLPDNKCLIIAREQFLIYRQPE